MIIKNNKTLNQNDFINEKELQTYFEKKLEMILNYKFIETEFTVGDFRIDTLAFDTETNSFRISSSSFAVTIDISKQLKIKKIIHEQYDQKMSEIIFLTIFISIAKWKPDQYQNKSGFLSVIT